MSHSNRSFLPNFNLIVQEPGEEFAYNSAIQQHSNNVQQQWMHSRPRSAQLNIPSPVVSVGSTVTLPMQRRSFDSSSFQQSHVASSQHRAHTDLLGLDMVSPSSHVGQNSYSPVVRDYNEESWNAFNLRSSNTNNDPTTFPQNSGSPRSFRNGPGSIGNVAPRSDSGFYSQSVVSHDAACLDRSGMQCSPSHQTGNLGTRPAMNEAPQMRRIHSDQQSQTSHFSSRSGNPDDPLKCRTCGIISKCKSDDKKHRLKHEKPWFCDWPRCKRRDGFTTSNDLDRHKKSVHRVRLLDKSYQCGAASCRNKSKIWPRRDNFKQHIERMHPEEDIDILIKKSTFVLKRPAVDPSTVSVAPIDTMVAGMEKTVSSHSNYEPVVELSAGVNQEISQWPTSLNPTDFPLNFHQASVSLPRNGANTEPTRQPLQQNDNDFRKQQTVVSTQQRSNIRPSGVAGTVGMKPASVVAQPRRQQIGISTAPQTKAEQQRLALKKFSQAVSKDSSTNVDLEQAILRILAGTGEPEEGDEEHPGMAQGSAKRRAQAAGTNKVFLSKSEAIGAAQAISNLIKQSPGSAYSQPRKTNQNFSANPKVCHVCDYAVARACDLKKHMKRHDKPYGCTYPKCHKRFGAKSDWKRHENSQHFQLEAYRCSQTSPAGKICGEHFLRFEHFKKHLESQHDMCDEDERVAEAKRRRIGKNCQQQFWCGFHGDIIELKEKRNAAWDERFDHIAYHFEKDGKSIEEWICAEENKTKKELLKEMDRYVFDDEDERGPGNTGFAAKRPPPPSMPVDVPQGPPPSVHFGMSPPPPPLHSISAPTLLGQKRGPSPEPLDHRSHKQQRQQGCRDSTMMEVDETKRFCCQCGDGPGYIMVQSKCIACEHEYCDNCPSVIRG